MSPFPAITQRFKDAVDREPVFLNGGWWEQVYYDPFSPDDDDLRKTICTKCGTIVSVPSLRETTSAIEAVRVLRGALHCLCEKQEKVCAS